MFLRCLKALLYIALFAASPADADMKCEFTALCKLDDDCVAVYYQFYVENLEKIPDRMQEKESIFTELAMQEKLGSLKKDQQSFNTVAGKLEKDAVLFVYARVTYKLENAQKATQFIDALQALQYKAEIDSGLNCSSPSK